MSDEGNKDQLAGKTSVREILNTAIGFERSARDFYTDLAPKVSKRIRYLAEELAEEEQRHVDLFTELSGRSDLGSQIEEEIARPTTDSKFSDCLHIPELGEQPDDQEVLQYAMGREHTAMQHYGELAETAPAGPIRDLFRYLANEETKHKIELEKLYYEIVHLGDNV